MTDRIHFEAAVWATIAVVAWTTSSYFNVSDTIAAFIKDHSEWQLDEFITLVVFLSISAFITSFLQSRRHLRIRRVAENEAFVAARRDVLTGLPNRQMFLELAGKALGEAWQSEQKCAVLFIDLDGFKPINDSLGHAAGDALLVAVGNRLQQCAPRGALAARLGGDEFAILLTNTDGTNVDPLLVAKLMLAGLQHAFQIAGKEVLIDASIGIASGPENGRRAEDLTNAADEAMYDAKRAGRGVIRVYQPKIALVENEFRPEAQKPTLVAA